MKRTIVFKVLSLKCSTHSCQRIDGKIQDVYMKVNSCERSTAEHLHRRSTEFPYSLLIGHLHGPLVPNLDCFKEKGLKTTKQGKSTIENLVTDVLNQATFVLEAIPNTISFPLHYEIFHGIRVLRSIYRFTRVQCSNVVQWSSVFELGS